MVSLFLSRRIYGAMELERSIENATVEFPYLRIIHYQDACTSVNAFSSMSRPCCFKKEKLIICDKASSLSNGQ
jgi:hypothetical protein